jgi:N-acetylgalactosamine-N,N'-diacetylbacillosaminyl-diphospho-undecaprenol 4-alpha-N-acetylgalactosaminyltransferase
MKPKIAIFINSLAGGGAERVTSYLLSYLTDKGYTIILVLTTPNISYPVPKEVIIYNLDNAPESESGIIKLLKLPLLAYKYARFLKTHRITHSFSLLSRPCYINIMARWFSNHKFKLIISERNYPSLQYSGSHTQAKINRFLVKWLYPKADLVVSNAKASAVDLIKNFNIKKERAITIYNPIDIEKINTIEKKENFFDSEYTNAITIGRLVKEKNHTFLLDAIIPFDKLRLYIFGEGELREALESKILKLGLEHRVFLMGFDNNPYQYLKAADFFLFGSLNEGFPNVLMEAMCCGLPIISTNCKSGPDEMLELENPKQDDIMITKYGILTPVNNVALMQKALHYVITKPNFLENCKPHLLKRIQNFNLNYILNQYAEILINKS